MVLQSEPFFEDFQMGMLSAVKFAQVLDLEPGSDAKSIKSAVRKLARKVHPDKCSLPGADEAFKSVLKAAEHVSASDTGAIKLA